MQKQSRVFFQISGAGHEALGLALARHLRPGYDWFFPYYRDQALMLGLGVTPTKILLQAVGSADDPSSGGRQMPAHWGYARAARRDAVEPDRQPVHPRGRVRRGGAATSSRRPQLPGCRRTATSSPTCRLGEGRAVEGEFWESLNTACTLHLPVLYVVADNGFAISVPATDQAPGAGGRAGAGLPRPRGAPPRRHRLLRRAASAAEAIIERVRAGVGPALIHADVVRPYSHSAADTQSKYRSADELAEEAARDPILTMGGELVAGGVLTPTAVAAVLERRRPRSRGQGARRGAGRAARPIRLGHRARGGPAGLVEDVGLVDGADAVDGAAAGATVTLGEAINRTLHEVMAADERIRVFGEDVADAREAVLAERGGQGRRVRHDPRAAARLRPGPLLQHAAVGGEHHRPGVGQALRGLRPGARDPVLRLHLAGHDADQERGGHDPLALERRVHRARWSCGCRSAATSRAGRSGTASAASRSSPTSPACSSPSRRGPRDAAGLLRYAFRCEDPVLFLEHKHLLRQPTRRDPFPPADYVIPFGRGASPPARATTSPSSRGAPRSRSRCRPRRGCRPSSIVEVEVVDLRTIVPWDHDLVAESVRRTHRLLVVHEDVAHRRVRGRGGGVGGRALLHRSRRAPVRRVAALDTHVAYEPTLEDAILPQVDDIAAAASALLACG